MGLEPSPSPQTLSPKQRKLVQAVNVSPRAGFDNVRRSPSAHHPAALLLELHCNFAHRFGAAGHGANLIAQEFGRSLRYLRNRLARGVHRSIAESPSTFSDPMAPEYGVKNDGTMAMCDPFTT